MKLMEKLKNAMGTGRNRGPLSAAPEARGKSASDRLRFWQDRLARATTAYEYVLSQMDAREEAYKGGRDVRAVVCGDKTQKTPHVRNLTAELIESQVSSSIPQPKVTPKRKQDEKLAHVIEAMLRDELDRMPFETMNDMMERTVPGQGGAFFLVDWDVNAGTHTTAGELSVSTLHPKQVIPQDGVYTSPEDMDYIILRLPVTKEYVRRRYGKDVSDETEEEPEVKSSSAAAGEDPADDMVTLYAAYYRNTDGGVGRYTWVGNTELEDLEDYQARQCTVCAVCGEHVGEDGICPACGSKKVKRERDGYEVVYGPIVRSDGTVIVDVSYEAMYDGVVDQFGIPAPALVPAPIKVPYYEPGIYPVILQKNVSVYGQLLGDSDIDKISDQQNTVNRLEAKIIDKLCRGGSYMTLPNEAYIKADTDEAKVIRLKSAADKSMIDVYDMEANISQDMAYLAQVYEEAKQAIGVTDSFLGRIDRTATSGKAKEFSAAQSAGRLESKRVMKNAAYAALFEAMFRFKLAYADEPRPVTAKNYLDDAEYMEFNRWDFLEVDDAGEFWWNDQFLFSCDSTAPLASNREAMWQETRMNLQSGAFGDPTNVNTLILFWSKMEMLHYPGAGETKKYLEEEAARQQEMAAAQAMAGQGGMNPQAATSPDMNAQSGGGIPAMM